MTSRTSSQFGVILNVSASFATAEEAGVKSGSTTVKGKATPLCLTTLIFRPSRYALMVLPPSETGVQISSLGLMTFAPNTRRPRTAVANELSIRSITCVSSTCSA